MIKSKKGEISPKGFIILGVVLLIFTILSFWVYSSTSVDSLSGWESFLLAILIVTSMMFIVIGSKSSPQNN